MPTHPVYHPERAGASRALFGSEACRRLKSYLADYNPRELLYGRGYDILNPEIAPEVIRQGIYDSLSNGIINSAGVGVEGEFDGIMVINFELFRPTPGFERHRGKLEGHENLQYHKANDPDTYPTPYDPLSDAEYSQSMSTFWTGALAQYKQAFPNARFAMYQAPRAFNFNFAGGNGWFGNQNPDIEAQQTDFDAEAAWLYPLLDVIAIHAYMTVNIDPHTFETIRNFHRDLVIRGIRLARQYRKPCLAYLFPFVQGQGVVITLQEMRAWYDGYLEALAANEGGWPMMGVCFWIGATEDKPGNVALANAFLQNKFVPAFIERFTIGTKTGIGGVIPAWP